MERKKQPPPIWEKFGGGGAFIIFENDHIFEHPTSIF